MRDLRELDQAGGYYCRHVDAMTSEKLHNKSDIAAELAYRDRIIDDLHKEASRYTTTITINRKEHRLTHTMRYIEIHYADIARAAGYGLHEAPTCLFTNGGAILRLPFDGRVALANGMFFDVGDSQHRRTGREIEIDAALADDVAVRTQ